ncbi:MAG: ATP-binding protein [Peptococcaceae bacterium]|mgnify:CR=1 FL=1|jgi:predicted HTH transcriptional regulator|nr:ATP-binding protein [Peptococcaceae bacterium]
MEKDVYMSISRKAKALLNRQEGLDVDFKLTVKGVQSTDLVAFANSEKGGTILVGVGEVVDGNSMQKGKIIGCDVGDKERLFILSKSESCVPPVEVNIIIENYARKPFFRIEIPSGKEKPYCTAGGTYKIRGDGRTNTLFPGRLLSLFVEKQSELFFDRFREATKEIGKDMLLSSTNLQKEMHKLLLQVLELENIMTDRLDLLQKEVQDIKGLQEKFLEFETELGLVQQKVDYLFGYSGIDSSRGQK